MGLSSNTILHQTSKESLKYFINQKAFPLSYSTEFLKSTSPLKPEIVFPMISFSDIPLSELHQHLRRYDDYTIGMSKEWAKRKKLNPVLYFEEKSVFTREIVEKFDFIMQKHFFDKNNEENKNDFFFFMRILAYAKNYEGELHTKKVNYNNYRFSDEREWRYVPEVAEIGENLFYQTVTEYNKNKENYKKLISNYKLPFTLSDINYIIVNKKEEIDEFYELLMNVFSNDISNNKQNRIPVNFFINDQIISDFL